MKLLLQLFVALTFQVTYSLYHPSHSFGPYYVEKNTPSALLSDTNFHVVKFAAIDGVCGQQFPGIGVYASNGASQINNFKGPIAWNMTLPCNSNEVLQFHAAEVDPENGEIDFIYRRSGTLYLNTLSSVGDQLSSSVLPSNFEGNSIYLTLLSGVPYIADSNNLGNEDFTQQLAMPEGETIYGLTDDSESLFVVGKNLTDFFLMKVDFNENQKVLVFPTISNPITFGSQKGPVDLYFFQRLSLSYCVSLYIFFTNPSQTALEVFTFDPDLNLMTPYLLINFNTNEQLVDVRCNADGLFVLTTVLDLSQQVPSSRFYFSEYDSNLNFLQRNQIEPGITTEEVLTPQYIAVVPLIEGGLYFHRERRQALGPNSEIFARYYTRCEIDQYGPSCLPCTCGNGICDSGEFGTGLCVSCNSSTSAGQNCELTCNCLIPSTPCSNGIRGDAHCFCPNTATFGFNCEKCAIGYYLLDNACIICPAYHYCSNSTIYECENNSVQGMGACPDSPLPTNPPNPTDGNGNGNGNGDGDVDHPPKYWIIALVLGLIFGLLLLVILILLIIYCVYKRRQQKVQNVKEDLEIPLGEQPTTTTTTTTTTTATTTTNSF